MKKYKRGYTAGVYDLFHVGHLNVIRRAKERCEHLIVAVSTDALVRDYKNKCPIIPQEDRLRIVEAIRYVDEAVYQETMDKMAAWEKYHFDAMFVGDDWKGTEKWNRIEEAFRQIGVDVVYLPHTDGVSTTLLTEKIGDRHGR